MRTRFPFVPICALALCMITTVAGAQVRMRAPAPKIEFPPGVDSLELPFELDGHLVSLPATLNGTAEVRFILDTGAAGMAIRESKWIEMLGLDVLGQARIGGVGSGGASTVDLAGPITLGLGDLEMTCEMVAVGFGEHLEGMTWDGVFGAGLLGQVVAEIDYESSRIRLHRPESFVMPDKATIVPTTLIPGGIAAAEAEITIDGHTGTYWLAVDIGAAHSLSLSSESLETSLPKRRLDAPTAIGWGVQGEVRGEVGIVDGFRLGDLDLGEVVTTFPDPEGVHGIRRWTSGEVKVAGNLGTGILGQFTVIIDHPAERIGLVPRKTPVRPFLFTTTGLVARLAPIDGGLPVHDVIAGSPAAEAGLRKGDLITTVNGQTIGDNGLRFRGVLLDPGLGERLELTVARDGGERAVTVTARRLLE